MNATANSGMVKCSVCKQMTAPDYIASRGLFSRTCRMCKNRETHERESQRSRGSGTKGLLGWILPALILTVISLWYFKVDVPGADQLKAFIARLFSSKSESETGPGTARNASAKSPGQTAPAFASDSGSQTLTLNLRSDVLFEFGNASLKSTAGATLRDAAKVIHQRPHASVVIRGYTDSKGSEQSNLALSRERAESVREWMIKNGIPAKQLSVLGMGAKDPVAPNTKPDGTDNPAGREQNRRVTLTVAGS